jgi:hypothetical protein
MLGQMGAMPMIAPPVVRGGFKSFARDGGGMARSPCSDGQGGDLGRWYCADRPPLP